ncbi:MAG: alanine dehydrogenase [Proteobacteria bacterium]|nr:alanine dehydrogenase [Pseudomonadota bacterium]MBU1232952.1 alanine dehydrogenase [Pseudomonadota bacterium]MBU1418693.1 alanine dehydrogenase [Pseudomonadota bacterium]MBU1454439.1 alanine dehydrogenase [Pseudomonadota bacterium]
MLIGVPKEIKNHEYRVGMTPSVVREAVLRGHEVLIETTAGLGVALTDDDYRKAGAVIIADAAEVFAKAEMIVKVKEPQAIECQMLHEGQLLFTYLHLAPDPEQTNLLLESGCTALAYETVTDENGGLPLLAPMSEVAGRMSIQVGAVSLQKANGGSGMLLGGVPGTPPAKVTIIGGGVVGTNAARMALGLGADVTILDKSLARLKYLDDVFGPRLKTIYATIDATEKLVLDSDLVVGAVLVPGAAAPTLVKRSDLSYMQPGSVLVDVSIDQGGCFETSHATTHADPTYIIDNVVHYCVANMPGAVAKTSTFALNNATLPFILALADKGWRKACAEDPYLREGLNIHAGKLTYRAVAESLDKVFTPTADIL